MSKNRQNPKQLMAQAEKLYDQGKLKEAIQILQDITREDSDAVYAKAQFNLGVLLRKDNDIDGAKQAYNNIQRSDSAKHYAMAQFNLGNLLRELKDIEGAKQAYNNIQHSDSAKHYAIAQFNLGNLLRELKDIEGAKQAYNNIQHSDSAEQYAMAQVNLGVLLGNENDIEGAKRAYNNIQRSDSAEQYAKAQFNLGVLLGNENDIEGAKQAYNNIQHSDSAEQYAKAQFNLGVLLGNENDIVNAQIAFNNSKSFYYYEAEAFIKILDLNNLEVQVPLYKILNEIRNVTENLLVDKADTSHEKKVAHYTRVQIAWSMIGAEEPSQFRLSTIQNVNDPKEGLVLYQYINKKCSLSNWFIPNTKEQMGHTFISCFTFNHDSLNQFRLYGKEDEREASGVSLVFTHDFFNQDSDNLFNSINNLTETRSLSSDGKVEKNDSQSKENKKLLSNTIIPLYLFR